MLPTHHWANHFSIEESDIEYLTTLLLEKETPMTTYELTLAMIERRLEQESAEFEERFKDTLVYNPSQTYETGQKLAFPQFGFSTATIQSVRDGVNPEYGEFKVAAVAFEDEPDKEREFAFALTTPHKLSVEDDEQNTAPDQMSQMTPEEVYKTSGKTISKRLVEELIDREDLTRIGNAWFPQELMIEVNDGHLNLTEAVLDIAGGGPLPTTTILDQIGSISESSPVSLQVFSLNYALNRDRRFDEVGPTGEILWYLARLAPPEVQNIPAALRYRPIEYNHSLLTDEMLSLEAEIGDELSENARISPSASSTEGTVILTYPHRRTGTLPLNTRTRHIFPTAERTEHIWITLVDGQDNEEYTGWIIPKHSYVYGLKEFYEKHQIPIGGYITVSKTDELDKIRIDYGAYRPRTEYIRLIIPIGEQVTFENERRSIGANYDDLMIIGSDDLNGLDEIIAKIHQQQRTLVSLLRMVIPPLGKLTPQGTAHIKTIYSAINVFRRCPPGPIMATLIANPDFENVGGHYWRLSDV